MRLIDADKLEEHKFTSSEANHNDMGGAYRTGWNDAIDAICDNAPTVEKLDWHYDEKDCTWYPYKHDDESQIVNDSQGIVKHLVKDTPYDEECMKCRHLKAQCEFIPSYCKYEPIETEPQTCSFSDCDNFKNPDYARCIECKRKQIERKTEPKRGAWVFRPVKDWGAVNCNCSVCGKGYFLIESDIYKYCPNCGAVME